MEAPTLNDDRTLPTGRFTEGAPTAAVGLEDVATHVATTRLRGNLLRELIREELVNTNRIHLRSHR